MKGYMENPTLKEFAADMVIAISCSVAFAWVFVYAIPGIAMMIW